MALEINREIPFSKDPNPAAKPFVIKGDDLDYMRALECLSSTIYYEAANESEAGQRAVAQVVLNRVRHPAFPQSICAVTYEGSTRRTGCQFSFTCDGALRRVPHPALWSRARAVAEAALGGAVFAPVGNATHYHANYVVPYWATELAKNAVVGTHIFYRWPGWWGQSAAFGKRHAGKEADPLRLRHAALGGRGRPPEQALPLGTDPRVELISVLHVLAAEPKPDWKPISYEREVRSHFSDHADHEAVRLYRQLQENPRFGVESALSLLMHYSGPPKFELRGTVDRPVVELAGGPQVFEAFVTALRAFAADSKFEEFYKKRQDYYADLKEEAREPTLRLLASVQRHTGADVAGVRLLLSPLLKDLNASGCEPMARNKSEQWILLALPDPREKTFKDHALLAKHLVGMAPPTARRPTRVAPKCSQPIRGIATVARQLPAKRRPSPDASAGLLSATTTAALP